MKSGFNKILTTHTGSLPRTVSLAQKLHDKQQGTLTKQAQFDEELRGAVDHIVKRQIQAGLTIINDGEQGKSSFFSYRLQRLAGFGLVRRSQSGGLRASAISAEAEDFPDFYKTWLRGLATSLREQDAPQAEPHDLCCTGPIGWRDFSEVERDIANLKAATQNAELADIFMSAISPATYAPPNIHYASEEEYLYAMADAMSREYAAIVKAGFMLQIDAPDLTTTYRMRRVTLEAHLEYMSLCVELINHATRDLPQERIRVHVCWGADEAPHHLDVPLKDIIHVLLRLRPHGMTIAGANGRHAHEWKVWESVQLPDEKYIVPGVIDSTNIIEHPQAVAERIIRYAGVLGREKVVAGVDCGFDTIALMRQVDPEIAWAKLRSLSDGAALASRELWSR
jgi:5-methyltetrahydropteroyltriglutamate--homocysteine methyltransferase